MIDRCKSREITSCLMSSSSLSEVRDEDKVIHQWRDWLLEIVGGGQYLFIKRDNKTVVRTIVAKNDMDAENQYQSIINDTKKLAKIEPIGEA